MKPQKFRQTEIGRIPEDWEIKTIGDLVKINEDTINKNYSEKFIEYIDTSSVDKGHLIETQKLKIDDSPSRAKRIIKNNDILISTVRPNLKHFYFVKKSKNNLIASTGFAVISSKKIIPEFLYYYLTTNSYTNYLSGIADSHASTYPSFNPDIIENSEIIFPNDENEQLSIAKIFSSLDAKIELNNKMNKTLEAIGQALFKKWFIDNPERKNWKEGKLGEIGRIQPGFAFKSSDFVNEGCKLIKIRNIQSPLVDIFKVEDFLSEEIFNKINQKFHLLSGDILIAMTGAELGKVGIIPKTKYKMLLNQRVGKVVSENSFLFYFYLISPEVQGLLNGISSTSSAQGNISNSDIEEIDIITPDKDTINKFTFSTKKMFELWISNLQQNQTLSQIRDALLPKLMSGEIRVE